MIIRIKYPSLEKREPSHEYEKEHAFRRRGPYYLRLPGEERTERELVRRARIALKRRNPSALGPLKELKEIHSNPVKLKVAEAYISDTINEANHTCTSKLEGANDWFIAGTADCKNGAQQLKRAEAAIECVEARNDYRTAYKIMKMRTCHEMLVAFDKVIDIATKIASKLSAAAILFAFGATVLSEISHAFNSLRTLSLEVLFPPILAYIISKSARDETGYRMKVLSVWSTFEEDVGKLLEKSRAQSIPKQITESNTS